MASTTKKTTKLTAFQQELITVLKKINEFKEACEANIVAIFQTIYGECITLLQVILSH